MRVLTTRKRDSRASLCSSDLIGVVTGSVTQPPTHRPAPSPFGWQLWKHADDIIHSETSCVCHTTTDLPPRINNPMTVCSLSLSLMEPSTLSSAGPRGDRSLEPEFHSQILSFFPPRVSILADVTQDSASLVHLFPPLPLPPPPPPPHAHAHNRIKKTSHGAAIWPRSSLIKVLIKPGARTLRRPCG